MSGSNLLNNPLSCPSKREWEPCMSFLVVNAVDRARQTGHSQYPASSKFGPNVSGGRITDGRFWRLPWWGCSRRNSRPRSFTGQTAAHPEGYRGSVNPCLVRRVLGKIPITSFVGAGIEIPGIARPAVFEPPSGGLSTSCSDVTTYGTLKNVTSSVVHLRPLSHVQLA